MMMMMVMMDCFAVASVTCQAVGRRDRDAVRSGSTQSALRASQHPHHHRSAARQVTHRSCSFSLSPISSSIASHSVFRFRLNTHHFHKSFPPRTFLHPPTTHRQTDFGTIVINALLSISSLPFSDVSKTHSIEGDEDAVTSKHLLLCLPSVNV